MLKDFIFSQTRCDLIVCHFKGLQSKRTVYRNSHSITCVTLKGTKFFGKTLPNRPDIGEKDEDSFSCAGLNFKPTLMQEERTDALSDRQSPPSSQTHFCRNQSTKIFQNDWPFNITIV